MIREGAAIPGFDLAAARQTVEDFTASTGVSCRLLSGGDVMHECRAEDACVRLAEAVGRDFHCALLHGRAPAEAARFGGRYIYACPMGLAFAAAAIRSGGALAGGLVAGPVQLLDAEDQLSGAAVSPDSLPPEAADMARAAAESVPRRTGAQLQSLSRLLFSSAVYISDRSHEMLLAESESEYTSAVDSYISYLRREEGLRKPYPLDRERELFHAVLRGDREAVDRLLNQILGHIYFYAVDDEEIHVRIAELFVVLLRAAACGGANIDHSMDLSRRFLWEIRSIRSQEQLTGWLAASLRPLMEQVFRSESVRHSGAMQKAVDYIKRRYASRLTLEEVADYVGYSPAYFSRIFREDTGLGFKEYLNELRVEKGCGLLLNSRLTITEIAAMLGFNDQSHFCKVFKLFTGVTPDRYRKRSRRIEYEKEYGG